MAEAAPVDRVTRFGGLLAGRPAARVPGIIVPQRHLMRAA
jgi:hypothetical protein